MLLQKKSQSRNFENMEYVHSQEPVITEAITICKNGFHYHRPNIFLKLLCMALRFRAYHTPCLLF